MIKDIIIKTKKVSPVVITLGQIDGGETHTGFISNIGRAWAWGRGSEGQLGDNSVTNKSTPVSVLGAVKTFCKIAAGAGFAGQAHTIAIDKNGRAWAWGMNNNGQLGDNTTISKRTPVSVLGAVKTFCQITAGYCFTLAIDKNGTVWGWGNNGGGNLGDNSITQRNTPVSVLGAVKTFCKIDTKGGFVIGITNGGRAWAWGGNGSGNLGDNSVTNRSTPVSVLGAVKTFCQIAVGLNHAVAIDKNGRAWGWGNNVAGQLGDNTILSKRTPVSVLGAIKTFCEISAGYSFTVAIDKNGRAWSWGVGGPLGDNTTLSRRTPVSVAGTVKTFCKIAAGGYHAIAIDKNGNTWAWGDNSNGQIGDTPLSRITPVSVLGAVKTFCQIVGDFHTVAIDKNGRAWGWGWNFYGQLGDNSITQRNTPVSILGAVKTFCQIAAGLCYTTAIDKDGRAWAWGLNGNGQLGDNTVTSKRTPVSVLGAVKTFCQIASGNAYTTAIDKNGIVWAWGINVYGQLGDNSITQRNTPVSILGAVKTFCKIAGGESHIIAIDKNGRAWAWGFNNAGLLGDNTNLSKRTPVSVLGAIKTFCQIAAGVNHSVAIDKNGRAWGWGTNNVGQIGDNSTTIRLTPVSVLGAVKTFCKIAAGFNHTIAIDKDGRAWAWGLNGAGQLGDNTVTSKRTPVSVLGAVKTFCQIAGGDSHTIAIDKNGRAWAWGLDTTGQLGDIQTTKLTPVRVCNI